MGYSRSSYPEKRTYYDYITKTTYIGNWILLEYLSSLHVVNEKLYFFELKYNTKFESIESRIKTLDKENFNLWDDYIEWKSYKKAASELISKISEVRSGNFEVVFGNEHKVLKVIDLH
jgi:hypothetical protein